MKTKKNLKLIILALILFASSLVYSQTIDPNNKDYVNDEANLFTEEQKQVLRSKISELNKLYNFDFVFLTVKSTEDKAIADFANDYYDYNGFGAGGNKDGLLFMLATDERAYYTSTTGYGITAFTPYGQDKIHASVLPMLKKDKYYDAFAKYLELGEIFIKEAKTKKPFDTGHTYKSLQQYIVTEAIFVVASMLVAWIVVSIMKKKMKNAEIATAASDFIQEGSFELTQQNDVFLYTTVEKIAVESKSSSDSGSNVSTSSSGTSHGGSGGNY